MRKLFFTIAIFCCALTFANAQQMIGRVATPKDLAVAALKSKLYQAKVPDVTDNQFKKLLVVDSIVYVKVAEKYGTNANQDLLTLKRLSYYDSLYKEVLNTKQMEFYMVFSDQLKERTRNKIKKSKNDK